MKFFLDTANIDEIKEALAIGLVDGITTNPTLLSKESASDREIYEQICELVSGPVSAEVVSVDCEGMVREGKELAKIAPNIVVKCPLITEGLKAVRILKEEGIRSNVTLCFSVPQAIFVAKAGAYIVSPFVGRLDDIGVNGMSLIKDIKLIYKNYGFETQVLVASIRSPLHIIEAARLGADIATIPTKVYKALLQHPLTNVGLKQFLDDHRSAGKIG